MRQNGGKGSFVLIILVIGLSLLVCLVGWFMIQAGPIKLAQVLWVRLRPQAYYMEVSEQAPTGYRRWGVYVEGDKPVRVNLLAEKDNMGCGSGYNQWCGSRLQPNELTIDQLIQGAQSCQETFQEDCDIKMNWRYGYLKRFGRIINVLVQVEVFVPCGETTTDCAIK